jgi:hypothetical protein
MVNNFFNSLELIQHLEDAAINGNKSALFKMQSKTHKLLGERYGILRMEKPIGIYDKIVDEVCNIIQTTHCTIDDAFIQTGRTRVNMFGKLNDKQIGRIKLARKTYGKNKPRNNWYS